MPGVNESKTADASIQDKKLLQLVTGAGIAGVGDMVGNAVYYLTSIIITRTIGAELYGLYTLGNAIAAVSGLISRLGLDYGTLRFVSFYKGKSDNQRVKGTIISASRFVFVASILVGASIFSLSGFLEKSIFKKSGLGLAIQILIMTVPLANMIILWLNTLLSFQKIKYAVCIEKLFQPFVKLLFVVVLFLCGLEFRGVLFATLASVVMAFTMACYYVKSKLPQSVWELPPKYENKQLVKFSFPVYLENILNHIILSLDIFILGSLGSAAEVGVFGVLVRLTMLIIFILTSFSVIFAPMISEVYGTKEFGRLERLYKTETRWVFTLTLPIFLGLMLFPEEILNIWGEPFKIGAGALVVMGIARFVDAGVGSAGFIIMMMGKPHINLINSALVIILKVILSIILIPEYGLIGAAVSYGICVAALSLLRLGEVYHFLKIHPYGIDLLKPIASATIGIGVLISAKHIVMIPHSMYLFVGEGAFFLVVYTLLIVLMNIKEKDNPLLIFINKRARPK